MIVVKHVDSIFGSLLPIRLSTFKLVLYYIIFNQYIFCNVGRPDYFSENVFKKYIYTSILKSKDVRHKAEKTSNISMPLGLTQNRDTFFSAY